MRVIDISQSGWVHRSWQGATTGSWNKGV